MRRSASSASFDRVRRTTFDSMPAMTRPTRLRVPARTARPRYVHPATSTHIYPIPHRRRRTFGRPTFGRLTFVLPTFTLPTFRLPSYSMRSIAVQTPALRAVPGLLRRQVGHLAVGLGHERVVAVAAAAILLSASFMSVGPGRPSGDTGGPSGDGSAPRLAIGGSADGDDVGTVEEDYVPQSRRADEGGADTTIPHPDLQPTEIARFVTDDVDATNRAATAATLAGLPVDVEGPYLDDGTLLKPVAVDTSVPDGSDLLQTYRVRSGDTLATIARRFDVSMMTLWWANKLKSKDRLTIGQQLRIPPVNGLVVEVTPARYAHQPGLALQGRRAGDPHHQRPRRPQPRRRPGARCCRARAAPRSGPQAQEALDLGVVADQASVEQWWDPEHGSPAAGLQRRQHGVADLEPAHQPVLPLRPLRHRHRRLDR